MNWTPRARRSFEISWADGMITNPFFLVARGYLTDRGGGDTVSIGYTTINIFLFHQVITPGNSWLERNSKPSNGEREPLQLRVLGCKCARAGLSHRLHSTIMKPWNDILTESTNTQICGLLIGRFHRVELRGFGKPREKLINWTYFLPFMKT